MTLEQIIARAFELVEEGLISDELAAEYAESLTDAEDTANLELFTPANVLADIILFRDNR